jgi:hypothetical protein
VIALLAPSRMQMAALVLLGVYFATAAVLLPRELAFLRGVDPPARRLFIVQDVLCQVSMLLVLLPCALYAKLTRELLAVVVAGFGGGWAAALWTAISRYAYTYHVLLGPRKEQQQRLREIFDKLKQEEDHRA